MAVGAHFEKKIEWLCLRNRQFNSLCVACGHKLLVSMQTATERGSRQTDRQSRGAEETRKVPPEETRKVPPDALHCNCCCGDTENARQENAGRKTVGKRNARNVVCQITFGG